MQCGHCDEVVTVPRSRFATGSVIGDFIILEEIGRGGMGVVYLAHQISLDRPAGLKILQENYANNPEFVVNFIKEARSAAKLNHPHIVQAYAVNEDEGVFYFAMEYIDGETMKAVLKRDKVIATDKAVTIIQQIAEALDCAWKEQKLIHRDIKPDNIMLTKNGRAKLADLGLSKVAGDNEDDDDDEIMGTPQYISPEHLTGAPMDVRSDIYSLGATFFHLVTGRFPYEGRTANEIARKHLEATLVPPHLVNPKVPEAISHIIVKMMKKNVNERYQDAEELVEDLRMFRRGKLPSTLSVPKVFTTRTRSVSRAAVTGKDGNAASSESQPFQLELPTTTTGSLRPLYTATTTTSSGMLFAGGVDDEGGGSKGKLWLIVFILLLIVGGGGFAGWYYILPMLEKKPGDIIGWGIHRTARDDKPERTYIRELDGILLSFSKNRDKKSEFLKKVDAFLLKYPIAKGEQEKAKLKDLLRIYVPLDEELRVIPARKKLRTRQLAEAKNRERQEQKKLAEQQRKAEARRREDAARRERESKAAAAKKAAEAKIKRYVDSLNRQRSEMAYKFVQYSRGKDYLAAEKMFKKAMDEPSKITGATSDEQREAKSFAAYGKELSKAFSRARAMYNLLYDSESKLAGTVVELPGRKIAKISSISNGVITAQNPFNNEIVRLKVDDMSFVHFARFVKRVQKKLRLSHIYFYYCLHTGNFTRYTARNAPDGFWKKEISNFEYNYFKHKLHNSSPSEQKKLRRRFGDLSSFKKAAR